MENVILTVHLILALVLTGVVLLQRSDGGGLGMGGGGGAGGGVMSGRLTQWNQISSTLPSTPITVIVRQESSGTTTLLTQHLAAVCTAAETTRADNTVVTFSGNGTFRNNFPGNTLPANFVQVEGSGGVQSALNSTPEAIAYLSPDPDYTPGAGTYALRLRNANDGVSYAPAEANINTALAASLIPPTGTLVTDPAAAGYSATDNPGNPLNWVKLVSNPSAGYPIVGTTNLLLSQCYSDARTPGQPTATESALRAYLDNHFANATRIRDHAFVPLPSTLVSAIRGAFTVGNTNGGQLLIGAATAYCSSVAGR